MPEDQLFPINNNPVSSSRDIVGMMFPLFVGMTGALVAFSPILIDQYENMLGRLEVNRLRAMRLLSWCVYAGTGVSLLGSITSFLYLKDGPNWLSAAAEICLWLVLADFIAIGLLSVWISPLRRRR